MAAEGTISGVTDGGLAATHAPRPPIRLLAAPATGPERNTIQARVFPLACWRVEDLRFEFDSSFVLPDIQVELRLLASLIEEHTRVDFPDGVNPVRFPPPLAVFGHADPVSNDDYNKVLSGRRAQAIYGMLTRKTELWEDLFSHPFGGDNWNTPQILGTMRAKVGRSEDTGPTTAATRAQLFAEYMDRICQDFFDRPFQIDPKDFLGGGQDSGGKADFQGCGEFNPVLMFSKEENDRFNKDNDKTARNEANIPNRRVLVFLFRPGSKVDPASWPCPRAKEGVAACKKRFWSDASKRREFQELRRENKETHDTFGCRFYDRLAGRSPCEQGEPQALFHFSLLLRSNSGGGVLSNLKYKIFVTDKNLIEDKTDDEGRVKHPISRAGDFRMEIEGLDGFTMIPSTPIEVVDRLHRVEGFFILEPGGPNDADFFLPVDPDETVEKPEKPKPEEGANG